MTTRTLRQVAVAVAAVFVLAFVLGASIGQHNDGPLGGLPAWLGTAAYATTIISGLLLLLVGLAAVALRLRRGRADHRHEARS